MDESLRAERHYPAFDDIHVSDEDKKRAYDSWDYINEIGHNPNDPQWKLVRADGNIKVYSKPSPYPNAPTEFRVVGVIDTPVKVALKLLTNTRIRVDWDTTLRVFDEVFLLFL